MSEPQKTTDQGILLEAEYNFYNENYKKLLLEYPNRYLLIVGSEVKGDFSSLDEAVAKGVRDYGIGPYLIIQSGEKERVFSAPALTLGILQCRS